MKRTACRCAAAWAAALERLCLDDRARREWLWLRAQEKGDEASSAALERADPHLARRMAALRGAAEALPAPELRREAYALVMEQLLATQAVELDAVECPCPAGGAR